MPKTIIFASLLVILFQATAAEIYTESSNENYIIFYYVPRGVCTYEEGTYPSSESYNDEKDNIDHLQTDQESQGIIPGRNSNIDNTVGCKLEVHFKKVLSSLDNYFLNDNAQYFQSVDFSNFDSSGITSIDLLFSKCENLQSVIIKGFSKVKSMIGLFQNCKSLKSIDFSNFNTSSVTNMQKMFYQCSALDSFDLSSFDTESVTDMSFMFYNCSGLSSIDLSTLDFSSLENMKSMFENSINLGEVKFPTNNFNNLNDISSLFSGCSSLTSVNLLGFDTTKVTNMSFVFNKCSSLKQIDLSSFKTSLVTDMSSLFSSCESLEIIDLTYFETSSVTKMDKMFYNCISLKILEISKLNLSKVESPKNMFNFGKNGQLKYINIYNVIDPKNIIRGYNNNIFSTLANLNVCQRDNTLSGKIYKCCYYDLSSGICTSDNYMIVYFGENIIYNTGFGNNNRQSILFIKNSLDHENTFKPNEVLNIKKESKIEIYFPEGITSLNSFFSIINDKNVEKIIFIDLTHLNTSSVNFMGYMFYGCSSLTSIEFTNFDTSLVYDMKYMFYNCKSLKSIDFSYFNTSSLEAMDHLFSNCISLEILDLSYFNTTLVEDMNLIFYNCSQLKVIDISNFDMKKVKTATKMFMNVTSLKYINLFHITDSYELITDSHLKEVKNLTVCQKEKIVQNKDINNMCCYYDIENEKCNSTNFILVYYINDVVYNRYRHSYRNTVGHLINVDYKNKLKDNEYFKVHKGAKLEVYFNTNEIDFACFFENGYDENGKYIVSIDFSYFHSTSLKSLQYTFCWCDSIMSIDLLNLNTSNVTDMSYTFGGCKSLKSINLSNFDTTLVTTFQYMFYQCESLTSIDISSFDTTSLTDMSYMFRDCRSLTSIDLSFFDTTSVRSIDCIFEMTQFNLLQYIDISHFNCKNTGTFYYYTFDRLPSLKYFDIYHVENFDKYIRDTRLKDLENITVCQKKKLMKKPLINNQCCYFNLETNKCESSNYIIIFYGDKAVYNFGFIKDENNNTNEFRKNIEFITNSNFVEPRKKLKDTDKLFLKKVTKLEIYFSTPLSSLEKFFDAEIDKNMIYAISIDLSHFDMSLVTNMNNLFYNCISLKKIYLPEKEIKLKDQMVQMFYGCNSLQSIDLYYFDTSSVTDMHGLFYNCNSLKNLDLSNFDTKSTINMSEMFYGCTSLKALDISSFNMKNVKENNRMFEGLNNLLYLNIYDVQNTYLNITNSLLNKIDNITVCQRENIITNKNIIKKCCYFNTEGNKCDSDNLIIIYYKEDCTYKSGFDENQRRNSVRYIVNGNQIINKNEELVIKAGKKIQIYHESGVNNLENYFSINYDPNADKIEKINLLNFDSSLVTDMNSLFLGCSSLKLVELSNLNTSSTKKMNFMFFGCKSLQIIDLSNFKTSLVTNMNYMFYGCHSLESLLISQLDTSSVINMNSMFSGCSSLKSLNLTNFKTSLVTNMNYMFYDLSSLEYLYITNFDMKNVRYADNIFTGINKLKYIDLYNVRNDNTFISESDLNKIDKLTVCQKEYIIKNKTTKCENEDIIDIKSNNYILLEYGNQTYYPNGFIYNGNENNAYRKDNNIEFILKENEIYKYTGEEELNIEAGTWIKIFFSKPINTLESFFDKSFDENVENIVFIDFSYFDSSSINNINSLFKGCSSLKSIDLSYIKTSLIKSMEQLFASCTSLKIINMSNLDLKNIAEYSSLFSGTNNLKYIILNNIQNYDKTKFNLQGELNGIENLIVCQDKDIIQNDKYSYICCNYSLENEVCEYENYIAIKFSEETEYPYGFLYKITEEINEYRNNNSFKIYLNNKIYEANNELIIPKDSEIIIKFESIATDLNNFFNFDNDENVNNIFSIDISHFDLSLVVDMSYMFSGCANLEIVDISNLKAPLLTNMDFMFNGCMKLKSINLENFKMGSLKTMKSMFSECGSLKMIDISSFNTSLVTNMKKLFYGCSSLTYIDASEFNTSLVTDMSFMFGGCTSLKYIDISNFNFESIQSTDNMFDGNDNLLYINLYNIKSSYSDIINSYLNKNTNLTVCQKEIIIPRDDINKNKCCYFNLERGICENQNYIIIKYGKDVKYNSGFGIDTYNDLVNAYRQYIDFIIYKDHNTKIKRNEQLIIYENSKIEIYFSNIQISIKNFFSSNYDNNVENIISIDFSHLEISYINDMSSLFLGCISLELIDMSNLKIINVKNVNSMFLGCNSLKSIILTNETISMIENMNSMFLECSSLQSIYLSNFITNSLNNMGKMFRRCQSLSSIDLSGFNTSLVIDMDEMFYKCDSLFYLDISNFDMNNTNSYIDMFSINNNIKYLNLYNFTNDKIIRKIFKKKKNFYYCQKNLIITNQNGFNCCDYNFETDDCDYTGPSHSLLDSSEIIETTENENELIVPTYPNTQYNENKKSTEIPSHSPINPETNHQIEIPTEKLKSTVIINSIKTDNISISTYKEEQIETNIVKTTIIATTIPNINIPTSITETTTPKNSTEPTELVLLAFSDFIDKATSFSFIMYFVAMEDSTYPETLFIQITIAYYTTIRRLSNIEGKCTLQGIKRGIKGQYLCEAEADTINIKQIKVEQDYKFVTEDNITVTGITPIANMYMDNIQNIKNEFGNLTNANIYILDHSIYSKYENHLINITGIIDGPQPNITNDNLILLINGDSDSDSKTQIELNCNIIDIIENNYTLNCKLTNGIKGDLQSAISFIDNNDILLVNFDKIEDSKFQPETDSNSYSHSGHFSRKNKSGLNAGAIVGIILACAIAVIGTIATMIYMKKSNPSEQKIGESTIEKIARSN